MNELSLFTGAGGGLLGTHGLLRWRCRGYVEFNDYCQRVIRQRIDDGILDEAPIFTDVREFVESGAAGAYRGHIDVVSGGFPCQPFSVAGKQLADNDPRDMWPATIGVIRAVRPRYCFLENVPGLLAGSHGYFGRILGDLADAGYDARWCVLSAADVGGYHERKRLWILGELGDNSSVGVEGCRPSREQELSSHAGQGISCGSGCGVSELADCAIEGVGGLSVRQGRQDKEKIDADRRGPWSDVEFVEFTKGKFRAVKPGIRLLVDGYPGRMDEVKAIGNGQVPLVAAVAWEILSGEHA